MTQYIILGFGGGRCTALVFTYAYTLLVRVCGLWCAFFFCIFSINQCVMRVWDETPRRVRRTSDQVFTLETPRAPAAPAAHRLPVRWRPTPSRRPPRAAPAGAAARARALSIY